MILLKLLRLVYVIAFSHHLWGSIPSKLLHSYFDSFLNWREYDLSIFFKKDVRDVLFRSLRVAENFPTFSLDMNDNLDEFRIHDLQLLHSKL